MASHKLKRPAGKVSPYEKALGGNISVLVTAQEAPFSVVQVRLLEASFEGRFWELGRRGKALLGNCGWHILWGAYGRYSFAFSQACSNCGMLSESGVSS